MKKNVILILIIVLCLAFAASPPIAVWRMRPSHFEEHRGIQEEIYAKYLRDGKLPVATDLSASA